MLWEGKAEMIPPVLPFYDHAVMMDELEAAMATTEYLKASPPVQMAFSDRWNQHRQFLMMEAQAQQQAMQSGMIQNAVAQATQQAAAMAAADAVTSATNQGNAQNEMERSGETRRLVGEAQSSNGSARPSPGGGPRRPSPFNRGGSSGN